MLSKGTGYISCGATRFGNLRCPLDLVPTYEPFCNGNAPSTATCKDILLSVALISPFARRPAATLPPPAALCEHCRFKLLLLIVGLIFGVVRIITLESRFVNSFLKKSVLAHSRQSFSSAASFTQRQSISLASFNSSFGGKVGAILMFLSSGSMP